MKIGDKVRITVKNGNKRLDGKIRGTVLAETNYFFIIKTRNYNESISKVDIKTERAVIEIRKGEVNAY